MAGSKPTPTKLNCKITDIQVDPIRPGRAIVGVEFDDGDPTGPWHQGFSILPEEIVTVDDFLKQLYTQQIVRPVDPYQNLKQVMQKGETFVLNMTAKIEPESQS